MINIATYGQLYQQSNLLKFSRYFWLSQRDGERSEHRAQGLGSTLYKNPTPVAGASSMCNALGVLAFPRVYPRSWAGTGPVLHMSAAQLQPFISVGPAGLEQCRDLVQPTSQTKSGRFGLPRAALQNNRARCQRDQMKRYFMPWSGQASGSAECQGWHFAQQGSYISGSTQTLRHFCTRVATFPHTDYLSNGFTCCVFTSASLQITAHLS